MADRKPLVSGNWKMHLTHLDAIQLVQKLSYEVATESYARVEVSVHPPFTSLRSIQTVIDADRLEFRLGAQNCHPESEGAFTGEISPLMLAKLDVAYVIVGHSERRQLLGETDEFVAAKVKAVFAAGMVPILCVGETLEEREAGGAEEKVASQVRVATGGLVGAQLARLVIAYEPIWAIGTGRTATAADAQSMCAAIRGIVASAEPAAAGELRVQYGGSVKPTNAKELLSQPDIDGALVGGASLEAESFARIVQWWREAS
jgi:triosephosphate isomerase (TIM)